MLFLSLIQDEPNRKSAAIASSDLFLISQLVQTSTGSAQYASLWLKTSKDSSRLPWDILWLTLEKERTRLLCISPSLGQQIVAQIMYLLDVLDALRERPRPRPGQVAG